MMMMMMMMIMMMMLVLILIPVGVLNDTLISNIFDAIDMSMTYPWGISYSGGWSLVAYLPKLSP